MAHTAGPRRERGPSTFRATVSLMIFLLTASGCYHTRRGVERVDLKAKATAPATGEAEAATSLRIANGFFQQGEYERALVFANKATSLDSSWADAYFNRALIYEGLNRPERAAEDYERYLALNPDAEERERVLAAMERPYYRRELNWAGIAMLVGTAGAVILYVNSAVGNFEIEFH